MGGKVEDMDKDKKQEEEKSSTKDKKKDPGIEWWAERGTNPTAVGFYRWMLTEYEKVVFLDADILVVRPIDELFQVTVPLAVSGTPYTTFRIFANGNPFPYLN